MAELVKWTSLQKLVYAKQLLIGTAALFIINQNGVNSCEVLKYLLLEELGNGVSTLEVIRRIRSRSLIGMDLRWSTYTA